MESIVANIFVNDMDQTINFYKLLGFEITNSVPDQSPFVWIMMTSEVVNIMFQTKESLGEDLPEISREDGGSLLLYIGVKQIRDLHNRIKDQVHVLKGLEKTFYGATEFSILDNNGYVLTFTENEG